MNTYAVFAETARTVIGPRGRSGLVLPTGIATDATTAPFFGDLVSNAKLVSFLGSRTRRTCSATSAIAASASACLPSAAGRTPAWTQRASPSAAREHARSSRASTFTMPPEEILLVNPNTGTCPSSDSRRDAEITIGIYKRVPVLWREDPEENPWGLSFMAMFHMANDSGLFQHQRRGDVLPLYEAKMVHHFDHRFGTYEGQTEAQANHGYAAAPDAPNSKTIRTSSSSPATG